MGHPLKHELRLALPAWAMAVLLPAPAVITSRNGGLGLAYFFMASLGLVAYIFRDVSAARVGEPGDDADPWSAKLFAAAIALLGAWVVFAATCLPLDRIQFYVCAALAFLALIPAVGVTPWMLGVTGNPFTAVVFSLTLVACMKLLGCVVVVLVYGWDASERGYTAMPWTNPNLLVWSFFAFTLVLSAIGLRRASLAFRCQSAIDDALRRALS